MYLCRSVLCCGSPVSLCSVACRRKGAVREARAHQGISDENAEKAAGKARAGIVRGQERPRDSDWSEWLWVPRRARESVFHVRGARFHAGA